jgi:Bacterial Ig-like domain (group 3)
MAWAGIALVGMVLPASAAAQNAATETTLSVNTTNRPGHTLASAAVTVTDEYGLPAAGAVNIQEGDRILASVALSSAGQATATFSLPGGEHALTAVYTGDASHLRSSSPVVEAQGSGSTTPGFQVTLAPVTPPSFPLVLPQGQSGTVEVTVTPVNNAALTSPMFVTLSCSGLPNESSCTFTPESLEISADTPTSCASGSPASSCPPISSMLLQTQAGISGQQPTAGMPARNSGLTWAVLLPGVLGLGGLAWGTRRRRWFSRLSLLLMLALVTTFGTAGCSPLYRYYQHGPGYPPATPAGTYNVTITAQSSNGITAITNSTTLALTVQ